MLFFLAVFFASPLFSLPLSEAVAGRLSFGDIPVWYLQERGPDTLILAGTDTFTFKGVRPQSFFTNFPPADFLQGHIYNKINGLPRTNYVFIRKDQIQSRLPGALHTVVVLKPGFGGNPPDRIRLNRVVQFRYRSPGGF